MKGVMGGFLVGVFMVGVAVEAAVAPAGVMLVRLGKEAGWEDFAFLAAVPASRVAYQGNRGLIALEVKGGLPVEVGDFFNRLKPKGLFYVGEAALETSAE